MEILMNPGILSQIRRERGDFSMKSNKVMAVMHAYAVGFDEMPQVERTSSESLPFFVSDCDLNVNRGEGLKFIENPNFVSVYHGYPWIQNLGHHRPKFPPGSMSFGYLTTPHEIVDAMYD